MRTAYRGHFQSGTSPFKKCQGDVETLALPGKEQRELAAQNLRVGDDVHNFWVLEHVSPPHVWFRTILLSWGLSIMLVKSKVFSLELFF